MGVHGLWKLIEPSGQVVPLESLAGKVLAVDVSIWLHQAIKGMHDASGAPVGVAHLLILFHRLCKLLFYKIKPVFVFDGGVPALKRQTMANRKQQSNAARSEAMKVREKLIKNLLKHEAVRQVLQNENASAALGLNSFVLPGPSVEEDLYKLPPVAMEYIDSASSGSITSESEEEEEERVVRDIHSVDVTSKEFQSLPPEVRHDILTELLETRKQSSWKNLDSMPKQSDSFSNFQMNRLLKRRAVQTSLEAAGKEMGGTSLSLKELEIILGDKGVFDGKLDLPSRRIAQDSVTHYMLVHKDSGDSSSNTALTQKKYEASEGFDIMEHLQDVEWSSESDTDVILQKSFNKSSISVKKKSQIEANRCSSGEENGVLFSEQKNIKTNDEIANILTILEDDSSDGKETHYYGKNQEPGDIDKNKVEINLTEIKDVKNEIKTDDSNVIEMDTQEEIKIIDVKNEMETNYSNKNKVDVKEETKLLEIIDVKNEAKTDDSIESKTDIKEKIDSKEIKDVRKQVSEDLLDDKAEAETKSLDIEESKSIEPVKIVSKPVEPVKEDKGVISFTEGNNNKPKFGIDSSEVTSPKKLSKKLILKEKITPNEELSLTAEAKDSSKNEYNQVETEVLSSSDSETDFVAIKSLEVDDVSIVNKTSKDIQTLNNDPIRNVDVSGDTITVTINPLDTDKSDDLFKDIFQPVSKKPVEENTGSRQENIDYETHDESKEIVHGSEGHEKIIQETTSEFDNHTSIEDLKNFKSILEDEQSDLVLQQGKQERLALNPTDQMYTDAQELLRLFGVPFIVAPMEAEAQCATLNMIGLTEGTITDDSDIWLFGGRVVYKNFFNQRKHVLEYRYENIQKYFKLSREDMIKMALLVGSDYTVGLNGVGPVTALEILASFQTSRQDDLLESLHKFSDWFTGKNKSGPPRSALKKKIRNTRVSPGFPNRAVAEAYLHPLVDDSKEPFSWAEPNVDLIQKYVKIKMGWSKEKCNEILLPVVRKLGENSTQSVLERYFRPQNLPVSEGMVSKRVEKAIKKLGNILEENEEDENPPPKKKRKASKPKGKKSVEEGDVESKKPSTSKRNVQPSAESSSNMKVKNVEPNVDSLTRLINQRLHQEVKIPQKEMTQKLSAKRKQEAIEIFRTFKKGGKKKYKVFAKKEANLSESSSEEN